MNFGGLQKNSLIDYPGKISCVLFLSGCNFACPYCHNPDLAKGRRPDPLSEEEIFDFLEARKGFLDGVVITGGEPTLQKNLASICEKVKRIGYLVKLDTNGSRPHIIKALIDAGLVDFIAMDIKTDPYRYASFIQKDCNPDPIFSSLRIILASAPAYEFRTTCVKPFVDADIIERIARLIPGARRYVLQQFHNTGVLDPVFFEDDDCFYGEGELLKFKSIAERWVQECIVR